MPFVTRLAGTADAVAIEKQRAKYIAIETVRRILPIILRGRFPELAAQCEAVADIITAYAAADAANAAYFAAYVAANAADAVIYVAYVAYVAANAAYVAVNAATRAEIEKLFRGMCRGEGMQS